MSNKIEYPCLMESTSTTLVVCFSSERKGHVVVEGNCTKDIGTYSESWTSATNADIWKPYEPPLYEDGEVCWVWSDGDNIPTLRRYDAINKAWCFPSGDREKAQWKYHMKFGDTLPFELPKIKD